MSEEKKRNHKHDEPSQEYQNFQRLLEGTLSVPKEELNKRRAEYQQVKSRRGGTKK